MLSVVVKVDDRLGVEEMVEVVVRDTVLVKEGDSEEERDGRKSQGLDRAKRSRR